MVEASYRDRPPMLPARWLAGLEPARREPATVLVPPGFVLVDVVLPSHRAFIADAGRPRRRQDQGGQGRRVERQEKGAGPERDPASPETTMTCSTSKPTMPRRPRAGLYRRKRRCQAGAATRSIARNDDGGPADLVEFKPGQRCEIVSVHHPVFDRYIGKRIIIVKVHPDTRQVWARRQAGNVQTNRAGRRGRFRPELHPVDLRLRPVAAYHLTRRTNE
jgi:hypothetical protein